MPFERVFREWGYGSTRNCAPAGGGAGVRRDRIAPIFTEALKIMPTGINPPNL